MDETTRKDLVDGLRRSKKMRDEEERQWEKMTEQSKLHEILTDQGQLQGDEIWQMSEIYMDSWEPTKRKINSIAEKRLANEPKQRDKKPAGT